MENQKTSKVTYAVFAFALIIVGINLVAVIFPSLILETILGNEVKHDPFVIGPWAPAIIISNLAALALGIAYYKNKIPKKISNFMKFVYNFEVSKNVAMLVFLALLFGFIGSEMGEVQKDESLSIGDYPRVAEVAERFPERVGGQYNNLENLVVKDFFLKSSLVLFQNIRVIPFLVSITLLILTYLFTYEITKKRFAGLVSTVILMQSFTFLNYDTIATYSNFWTMFYLLSLYLIIKKKWYLSPVAFIASVLSKGLTAAYLPLTLFFIIRSEIPRKKKFQTMLAYTILAAVAVYAFFGIGIDVGGGITTGGLEFYYVDFWSALANWSYQMRFDGLFLMFILPLTVGLFLCAKKVNPQAESILFLIAGIEFAMVMLAAITGFNIHPYRYVPLVVFFAIGVGTLFSNKVLLKQL